MSWLELGRTTPVARKEHTCSVCVRKIEPGEKYLRIRHVGDDGADTFKCCAHCDLLSTEIWRRDPDLLSCDDEDLDVAAYLADYARGTALYRAFHRRWRGVSVDAIPLDDLPDMRGAR